MYVLNFWKSVEIIIFFFKFKLTILLRYNSINKKKPSVFS